VFVSPCPHDEDYRHFGGTCCPLEGRRPGTMRRRQNMTAMETSSAIVTLSCRIFVVLLCWILSIVRDVSGVGLAPAVATNLKNKYICQYSDKPGIDSWRGLGIFLFTTASRTALGPTQPPIQWVPGTLSLGVKRAGREADHSHPSSAEVKELVELYLHSPIRLHGVMLSLSTGTILPLPLP
jgi:hypothetical protein